MAEKHYGPTEATPTACGISARVGRACAVLAQAREQLERVEADLSALPSLDARELGQQVALVRIQVGMLIIDLQRERDTFARATGVRTRAKRAKEGE